MRALHSFQQAFSAAIFSRDEAQLSAQIAAHALPADDLVAIYRNNTFSNLKGALADVYPVVLRIVGEEFFGQMARAYTERYPSLSGDIQQYGIEFGCFIASYDPVIQLPYLADVAALEWAYHEAFHAAVPPSTLMDVKLAEIPINKASQVRFRLHPACRLIRSDYPIGHIWRANQPEFSDDNDLVNLNEGGVYLLVRRPVLDVEIIEISAADFACLTTLHNGEILEAAVESASAIDPLFDLTTLLRGAVTHASIVDCWVE